MAKSKNDEFFKKLGARCRKIRQSKGWTQEDLMNFGFSTRHYQRIESGLQINMVTALRLSAAFEMKLVDLIKGVE